MLIFTVTKANKMQVLLLVSITKTHKHYWTPLWVERVLPIGDAKCAALLRRLLLFANKSIILVTLVTAVSLQDSNKWIGTDFLHAVCSYEQASAKKTRRNIQLGKNKPHMCALKVHNCGYIKLVYCIPLYSNLSRRWHVSLSQRGVCEVLCSRMFFSA